MKKADILAEHCVVCTCGYISKWFDRLRDAEDDELEHVRQMSHAEG